MYWYLGSMDIELKSVIGEEEDLPNVVRTMCKMEPMITNGTSFYYHVGKEVLLKIYARRTAKGEINRIAIRCAGDVMSVLVVMHTIKENIATQLKETIKHVYVEIMPLLSPDDWY